MATEADKPKAKAKVGKPPAKKAAPAKKPAAAKAEPKKAAPKKAAPKKATSSGQIKVTQIGSAIARRRDQKATLIGLGLNKINRSRVLADTPETRGMVRKVSHLVKVENVG